MIKIWPKQADKKASVPDANLLSASQNAATYTQNDKIQNSCRIN